MLKSTNEAEDEWSHEAYRGIGLNSCFSEAWVCELPLALPHGTITDQQAIAS